MWERVDEEREGKIERRKKNRREWLPVVVALSVVVVNGRKILTNL